MPLDVTLPPAPRVTPNHGPVRASGPHTRGNDFLCGTQFPSCAGACTNLAERRWFRSVPSPVCAFSFLLFSVSLLLSLSLTWNSVAPPFFYSICQTNFGSSALNRTKDKKNYNNNDDADHLKKKKEQKKIQKTWQLSLSYKREIQTIKETRVLGTKGPRAGWFCSSGRGGRGGWNGAAGGTMNAWGQGWCQGKVPGSGG